MSWGTRPNAGQAPWDPTAVIRRCPGVRRWGMTEMNTPIERGSDDADRAAKIAGILEQTRADELMGHTGDVGQALDQRLADAGISLDDDERDRLLDASTE